VTWEEARRLFPVLNRIAYLNAGTFGPLALPTIQAMEAELEVAATSGRIGHAYFERVLAERAGLRERLAALVGVEPAQIALSSSTTDGCNIVLAGLELAPGDEIITTSEEHFGLLGPLQASGAHIVVTDPDPEAIVAAVTPRTRLLALSHVLWTSGRTLPVRELRDRSGLPILVDGAQSVGAIRVDASGLDYYTISGQKWLCGPDSTGALVVAEPDRLRVARPSYFAQSSYEPTGRFEPREGAARFDSNWLSAASIAGLLAALGVAPRWCYERAAEQAARCRELLEPHADLVAGDATLVSFRTEDPPAVVKRLAERDVQVREIPKTGLVRVSCGWWTGEDDLQRLVDGIRS